MNVRLLASQIINDVTDGCSLSDRLPNALASLEDPRQKAFLQAVCYGVCRHYTRLDFILSCLLEKPMKAKDSDVHALLLVGLYQLTEMRVPAHAAVDETVSASEGLKKSWARGFINALLRNYLRNQEALTEEVNTDEEAFYLHPEWWITAVKKAWPSQWESILAANNEHPTFSLRVNQQRLSREKYLEILQASSFTGHAIEDTSHGVMLETAIPVDSLPGFVAGDVSVQDGAAQLAAPLLQVAPGMRVLDACAAPGGKLTHLLESEPALAACVAVESHAKRTELIKENLRRLKLNADCISHDVGDVKAWWDGELFDRILLDAPCSASGVIRRHPDIKLLRFPADIKPLQKEQLRLLNALWPVLKPGGMLVYATCSIFPEENVDVMQQFMATHADAKEVIIDESWGVATAIGRQILPSSEGKDGFYYARLRKE